MNPLQLPWIDLAILAALVGSISVSRMRDPERASRWGVVFTGISFSCTFLAWLAFYVGIPDEATQAWSFQRFLFGRTLFALDEVNAPLVPTIALLHFLTGLATARTKMRRFSFSWSLAAEVIRLATFSCKDPWVLIGLLAISTLPPYVELLNRGRTVRVYVLHMGLFVGLLVFGWMLVESSGGMAVAPRWTALPLTLAILIRCGTVPAHVWLTDWFEHASLGIALLFVVPLSGVYAAVRLVLPVAPDWVLQFVGLMSLFTAVYAAAMATIQREARRFYSHLFLSHASLVLVGMELHTEPLPDRFIVPVVFGDLVAGRLRPDAAGARGPVRPAVAERLSRLVRAFAHAGRLLPAHRTGERGFSGHAGVHFHRATRR